VSEPPVRCRYCPEMILWSRSEKGNAMCFDAVPSPGGRWAIFRSGTALYVKAGDEKPGELLYLSHWASCTGRKQARAEHPRKVAP
jgi:hypothetical protein